ncbi:helix-turn-helix transcriptional regulator [[Clostridium] fimetarium]|uniref:Helix-turn-helix domain-containing protein n=1 Tax=[Clostridium] fimetarium TaxID=99656 RepID=A0A1I0NDJ3_9FIRM|nr:helix-turn-helix transcriptional regulator [[Clostridium] fimetarium]SEV99352.1 Helix-turn-helix domain-containing protein [[Clostridium] fimetarium]
MDSKTQSFIENILFDTLFIDFHYFQAPFTDISTSDRYLRKGLFHADELYSNLLDIFSMAENNYFYIVRDKYMLQYIIFRPFKDNNDIISIGPYTSQPINENFFIGISKLNHLDFTAIESLKGFMHRLPFFINNINLIVIINDIITYINPNAGSYELQYINLSSEPESEDYIPINDFELFVDSVKKRYEIESEMLGCISESNHEEALIAYKRMSNINFEQRHKDVFHERKALLYTANTLFRKAAEKSKVHPLYLHQMSSKFAKLIEQVIDLSGVEALTEKMIRDYCLMVKNKSRIQYSPIIRNAINYIELNLNSSLSLSILANELHVSSPYLSSLFKHERGITITDFINKERIHTSLKLLSTTNEQIQDIAFFVGIHDINYFTKIFKKEIGVTPRDYRKKFHT